ncbi:DUF2863 family protein [Leeia oryzae]|uniref:DUF2863 family protein n=1 Tax=Leeia oryzae TaxID=356662 RepID=UPI000364A1EE|nr:DUF2863 family protein [Leeia oryzae]
MVLAAMWEDLPEEGQHICHLVQGLSEATSQTEARGWAVLLTELLTCVLLRQDDDLIGSVLTKLTKDAPGMHEVLLPWVEATATKIEHARAKKTTQLIALPVLAWSRFNIPDRVLQPSEVEQIRQILLSEVFSDHAAICVANKWFSPEQIPQTFGVAHKLLRQFPATRHTHDVSDGDFDVPEVFLSDTRYLLMAVTLPRNGVIYQWQTPAVQGTRQEALARLEAALSTVLSAALPGCVTRVLMPDAFFSAWKAADIASRAFAIKAAATFLSMMLECPVSELDATVAVFEHEGLEEVRIGFARQSLEGIQYGLIWPLWGEELAAQMSVISEELKQLELGQVHYPVDVFSALEDGSYDTPAYVDRHGHVVEALMPDVEFNEIHLH